MQIISYVKCRYTRVISGLYYLSLARSTACLVRTGLINSQGSQYVQPMKYYAYMTEDV